MKLQLPKPVNLHLSDDEWNHLESMTTSIYSCPKRNKKGRSWDKVFSDTCSGVILEFAIQRQGGVLNPATFDHRKSSTHNWDVEWNGFRHEVKSCWNPELIPKNGKYVSDPKWVNISKDKANKLAKNRRLYPNCVDTVIFGYYNKISQQVYECKFRAIVPFKTIRQSLRKSNFNDNFYINEYADSSITINPVKNLLNEQPIYA